MSPDRKKTKTGLLYVSEPSQSSAGLVDVFSLPKYSPDGQITDGIDKPQGLAIDTEGNLYVADLDSNAVTVYRPRGKVPSLTLNVPDSPLDVAVGSNGYVYVGDEAGGVDVYRPGAKSPTLRLTNPSLTRVAGVAVTSSNDVYADGGSAGSNYYTPAVVEFTTATRAGKNLGLTGLVGRLGGVIVADHDLIVSDPDSNEILTYPLGQTSPSSTISVPCPDRPTINKAENKIYVPEACSKDTVGVYDYPSGTLVTNLPIGSTVTGAALKPCGGAEAKTSLKRSPRPTPIATLVRLSGQVSGLDLGCRP
ncbi:MAG: hypothetical protein ABSF08_03570 [Candidatus Cybelea sp.]|jgi:hypothetical protein